MPRSRRFTPGRIGAVLATAALASAGVAGAASAAGSPDIQSVGPGPGWVNR
jgi:hypothetical protein